MLHGIFICLCFNPLPGRCRAGGGLQEGSPHSWCGTLSRVPEDAEQTLFTKRYVCIPNYLKAGRTLTQSTVLFWLFLNSLIGKKQQAFHRSIVRPTNSPQPPGDKTLSFEAHSRAVKTMHGKLEREFRCKTEIFKGTLGCWEFRYTQEQKSKWMKNLIWAKETHQTNLQ